MYALLYEINPLVFRITALSQDVPLTFIYGSRSWVDSASGVEVQQLRPNAYVDVQARFLVTCFFTPCASQYLAAFIIDAFHLGKLACYDLGEVHVRYVCCVVVGATIEVIRKLNFEALKLKLFPLGPRLFFRLDLALMFFY